jgi:transposase
MPERRRRFSPQFKAGAVQLVIETGKPIAEVARDLGVNDGTLGNWVKAWRDANPEREPALSPVERARMTELEDEVRGNVGPPAWSAHHVSPGEARRGPATRERICPAPMPPIRARPATPGTARSESHRMRGPLARLA